MDGVIGYLCMFGGNFPPRSWAYCQGQIMSISSNTALFSILGTTYGGNGQTTFALPDLRGRVPIGAGQGPGLSNISLGQVAGTESTTLSSVTMPAHSHPVAMAITMPAAIDANTNSPANGVYANGTELLYTGTPNVAMQSYPGNITTGDAGTGSPQPFSLINPIVGLNYLICLTGIFPSRN